MNSVSIYASLTSNPWYHSSTRRILYDVGIRNHIWFLIAQTPYYSETGELTNYEFLLERFLSILIVMDLDEV